MALVINDRVKETSTTTGTGAWHLEVLQLVLKLLIRVLEILIQLITVSLNRYNEFEVGLGTLDGTSANLTRTTVISTSNGDAAVNFSAGTKDVFCTLPASKSVYLDATGTPVGAASRFCT